MGKVTVWFMTEEERLDYIKRHPIIPTGKPKKQDESNYSFYRDFEWRGRKGNASRYGRGVEA